MKVLVTGGRHFKGVKQVWGYLDKLLETRHISDLTVIQGGATGADKHARDWCLSRGVHLVNYPADWNKYGRKAAGPIRNRWMLMDGKPDIVVAFPGGKGTADMIRQAKARNIEVIEICER